jgi:hypothetical protein
VKGGSVVVYDRWTAYFFIPDNSEGLSVVQDGFFSDDGCGNNRERYVLEGGDSIFAEGKRSSIDRVCFISDGLLMPLLHGAEGDWDVGEMAVQSLLNSGVQLVVLEKNDPLASQFRDYVTSLGKAVNAGIAFLVPPSDETWMES